MAELFDGQTKDVLENLRLLKAFLRIKDPTVRRAIIELVERKSTLLTSEKKVLTLASVER
jgi:hypothetical protein